MAYVIPRDGEILVDGTEEFHVGDMDLTLDREAMILKASEYLDVDLAALKEIRIVVGVRPCRLDRRVRFGPDPEVPRVTHNYGHGGSGFSLARGCAEDGAKLVHAV